MTPNALPFALCLMMPPLFLLGAAFGGAWLLGVPLFGYLAVSLIDRTMGRDPSGPDPETPEAQLLWHRALTLLWVPVQAGLIVAAFAAVFGSDHLSDAEGVLVFVTLGIVTGGIGITYAHELIHQRNRWERGAGLLLLLSVLYGHFATEHVQVHHRYVGTPKDPVTARYNEGFHRFFARVLWGCFVQSWAVERDRLARIGLSVWHRRNPFWVYGLGQGALLLAAAWAGGLAGVGLYALQAFVAVLQLELVNYVEHYGLTRKHLGGGRYEPVQPHHSWNADQRGSNWLLINLQRHSDHHWKPDRRFPLLQSYPEEAAPALPFGYPLMCWMAAIPPLWRRVMNPRVRAWRRRHYPEIADWTPYRLGTNPMPR